MYHLFQGQHGQQWDGELGNDQDGGHGAELGIHGHIVKEEVGEAHEILSPRQEDGEDCGSQQGPLHGTAHDEQAQDEEYHHEGTHVHRTRGAGLFAPVLTHLVEDAAVHGVGLLHGLLVASHGYRGTSLGVGHQQGPCLADAIAPGSDVVALQSAACLVARVGFHQFALAAHGLLAVFIGVIEVRQVGTYTHQSRNQQDGR